MCFLRIKISYVGGKNILNVSAVVGCKGRSSTVLLRGNMQVAMLKILHYHSVRLQV